MGALILGIVLIIGYHYQTYHPIRRLELIRRSGYHIYFNAGFSGFILLCFSVLIWSFIDFHDFPSSVINKLGIDKSVTFLETPENWVDLKAIAISILMFIVSISYVSIWKIIYYLNKGAFFNRLLKISNDFERLIIFATYNAELIRIELECGKVYVGIPESPDLEGGEVTYVTILPFLSGFRTEEKKIVFSNNYVNHYEDSFKEDVVDTNGHSSIDDFFIVIPVKDVVIASKFDLDAFVKIQAGSADLNSERKIRLDEWSLISKAHYKYIDKGIRNDG